MIVIEAKKILKRPMGLNTQLVFNSAEVHITFGHVFKLVGDLEGVH